MRSHLCLHYLRHAPGTVQFTDQTAYKRRFANRAAFATLCRGSLRKASPSSLRNRSAAPPHRTTAGDQDCAGCTRCPPPHGTWDHALDARSAGSGPVEPPRLCVLQRVPPAFALCQARHPPSCNARGLAVPHQSVSASKLPCTSFPVHTIRIFAPRSAFGLPRGPQAAPATCTLVRARTPLCRESLL